MKVLLISLFHPELIRGGAQQICYELFEGLKEMQDVSTTLLASVDRSSPGLYKSGARITGFDGRQNEFLYLSTDYDYWWHKTSDVHLIQAFVDFLQLVKPDVVHFHHFLTYGVELITLTRKILPDCKIIFTFHEFLAICNANGQMKRRFDGSLCTGASPVRCHQCFPEHSPEKFFMRDLWIKKHLSVIDVFTTPSKFMIEHYVKWGIDRNKIIHVSNGQKNYALEYQNDIRIKRNRFGFFGQLVDNKGVYIILQAVDHLRAEGFTDFSIEINGDNLRYASEEKRREIEEFIKSEAELPQSDRNVVFNGSYHVTQLHHLMSRVDWCIVPSVWEEVFALVISEAWMFRRPVIGSNVGAIKERVRHEENGLLFEVGDSRSLANMMKRACSEDDLWGNISSKITEPPPRTQMVNSFMKLYQ